MRFTNGCTTVFAQAFAYEGGLHWCSCLPGERIAFIAGDYQLDTDDSGQTRKPDSSSWKRFESERPLTEGDPVGRALRGDDTEQGVEVRVAPFECTRSQVESRSCLADKIAFLTGSTRGRG